MKAPSVSAIAAEPSLHEQIMALRDSITGRRLEVDSLRQQARKAAEKDLDASIEMEGRADVLARALDRLVADTLPVLCQKYRAERAKAIKAEADAAAARHLAVLGEGIKDTLAAARDFLAAMDVLKLCTWSRQFFNLAGVDFLTRAEDLRKVEQVGVSKWQADAKAFARAKADESAQRTIAELDQEIEQLLDLSGPKAPPAPEPWMLQARFTN